MDISACKHAARQVPAALLLSGMLMVLAACGEKQAQAPAPVTEDHTGVTGPEQNAVAQLLDSADQAVKEGRLFLPAGESAFEQYLRVLQLQADQADARTALLDLSPYAVLYVERMVIAGDLAESERVLALMTQFDTQAPALRRLHGQIEELRARQLGEPRREPAQTAQQQAAQQAQQQAAQQAARQAAREAAAPTPVSEPEPVTVPLQRPEAMPPRPEPVAQTPRANPVRLPTATNETQTPPPALDTSASSPTPGNAAATQTTRNEAVAAIETPAAAPRAAPPAPSAPAPEPPTARTRTGLPGVVSSVQPRYPSLAIRRRIEGSVEVGFTIMPDGSVSNVRVLNSHPSGTFDREAVNAMERWRFVPSGQAVESRRVFDFRLQ